MAFKSFSCLLKDVAMVLQILNRFKSKNISHIHTQEDYDAYIASLDMSSLRCPACKSVGTLKPNTTYSRYFADSVAQETQGYQLTIVETECSCCHRYHALFPDWICPFLRFSYPMIAVILDYYFNKSHKNKTRTARHFSITVKVLRHLLSKLASSEKRLRSLEEFVSCGFDMATFVAKLKNYRSFLASTLADYLLQNSFSFLYLPQINPSILYTFGPHGDQSNNWKP